MSILLAACALAAPVQVPDVYVLARFSRIMRLSDWNGPAPTLETVVTHAFPTNFNAVPRGLEIDRVTGDFLVLFSSLPGSGSNDPSAILRVDRATGATLSSTDLPYTELDGLEQRRDGELFALNAGSELVRLDLAAGTAHSVPLDPPLPRSEMLGMTMDETGYLIVEEFSSHQPNARYRIDPANGTWSASTSAASHVLGMESDGAGHLLYGGLTFSSGMWLEDVATGSRSIIPGTNVTSNIYALAFAESVDGEGVHPICTGRPNSTGVGATLETLGTNSLSANDLELYSRRLPPVGFGYYLTGPNVGIQPVGSGVLCIGGPQSRYSNFPLHSGTSGVVRFAIDAFQIPGGGVVAPGRTDVFQYWYRDFGGTSNLSDAVSVTWR